MIYQWSTQLGFFLPSFTEDHTLEATYLAVTCMHLSYKGFCFLNANTNVYFDHGEWHVGS